MALEPITRKEQIIAGKNLEPITRMERFLKEYGGGGGGGASHWNELEGKPFVTVGGDTLEWDGNTEGKSSTMDGTAYHVSDVVLTIADFANGATAYSADMEFTIDATSIVDVSGDGGAFLVPVGDVPVIAVCSEKYVGTDFGGGLMCDKAGIYLLYVDANNYISSLTIPGYTGFTKEKIDPAVLPTRKFYCDATDMVYLYTDKALTTKATREEVMEAILNNAIVIVMVHLGAVFATAHIAMANYSGTYATIWAIISISDAGVATYTKLYTAEYTAS